MRLLADTQVLVWYVTDPARLSAAASAALEAETARLEPVGVSAFSLVELAYAVEKRTNAVSRAQADAIDMVLEDPETPFEVVRSTPPLLVGWRRSRASPTPILPSMTGRSVIW